MSLEQYAEELLKIQAQEQMRLISAITFPHWAGDSKDPKVAARAGRRSRRKYMQQLHRQAAGAGIFDEIPGVTVARSLDEMEGWLWSHRDKLGEGVIDRTHESKMLEG